MFQILDEMNLDDTKNGTRLVSISNSLISIDKVKAGTKVSMGADDQVLTDLANNKCIALLIIVNRDDYFKREGVIHPPKLI
jgi:hypothetical protein